MVYICRHCGKKFTPKAKNERICSDKCRAERSAIQRHNSFVKGYYETKKYRKHYHHKSTKIDVKCEVCSATMKMGKKIAEKGTALRLCSMECAINLYDNCADRHKKYQALTWITNRGWTVAEAREEYIDERK